MADELEGIYGKTQEFVGFFVDYLWLFFGLFSGYLHVILVYLQIICRLFEIICRLFVNYFCLFEIICGLFERLFLNYLRWFADYLSIICRLFEIICRLFERLFPGYSRLFADYLQDYFRVIWHFLWIIWAFSCVDLPRLRVFIPKQTSLATRRAAGCSPSWLIRQ